MNELRYLLDRFWVTRAEDKDLYLAVKRALPRYRRLTGEHLGWNLVVNEAVIKLEKVPPRAMPWMGIQDFQETMDYCLLCALLLYLADLDDGAQFLLSSLTEAAEAILDGVREVDWTRFPHRKSLVRVLQYAQRVGMLVVYDGTSEGFGADRDQEVLYENTGLSRHFAVHFGRDIMRCGCVEDFERLAREGEEAQRARQTRRVCRQLALAPALYWSEGDRGDYEYVKSQRAWLDQNLGKALEGEVQVHKNGAFLVLDEEGRSGLFHPRETALSDAVLLLCGQLREKIAEGVYLRAEDDTVLLSGRELRHEITECRERYGNGWGRRLRELPFDRLCQEMTGYMADWMLLEKREDGFLLYPAAGKWVGRYPERYLNEAGEAEEDDDEPLEDE